MYNMNLQERMSWTAFPKLTDHRIFSVRESWSDQGSQDSLLQMLTLGESRKKPLHEVHLDSRSPPGLALLSPSQHQLPSSSQKCQIHLASHHGWAFSCSPVSFLANLEVPQDSAASLVSRLHAFRWELAAMQTRPSGPWEPGLFSTPSVGFTLCSG